MRCDDIERWISKSMDNELSVKEVGQMRQHLEHCAPCRQSFEDSRDLRAWFVPGAAVAVPAGFAQRVVAEAFAGKASVPTFTPLKGGGASADSAMPGVDRFTVRLA
ncbi:MAG TPA: zf-HC2 domain-containing protein, partial [Planctomycetota bacterium]|nr:zf-HC2 domain-containing protein [Planctomycetota bacterium]